MQNYHPANPPSNPTADQLALYLYEELLKISGMLRNPEGLYMTPQAAELPRPQFGDLYYGMGGVYSGKEGFYYYSSVGLRYISNQNPP